MADGRWVGALGCLLGGSRFREGGFREGRFRDGCTDGLSWVDCQVVDRWHDGSDWVGLGSLGSSRLCVTELDGVEEGFVCLCYQPSLPPIKSSAVDE